MRRLILILSSLSPGGTGGPRPGARRGEARPVRRGGAEGPRRAALRRTRPGPTRSCASCRPETAEVHAQLGLIYFQQHDFARAVPSLRQALKLKPGLPNVDILLAMCLSELGQYKEALPGLRRPSSRSPTIGPAAAGRPPAAARLHGPRAGRQGGRGGAGADAALHGRPEVLYHTGRLFSNYAYLHDDEARRGRARLDLDASGRGRGQREPGRLRRRRSASTGGAALAPDRPGIHYRHRPRAPGSGAASPSRRPTPSARTPAAKEFEEELRIDPTNANAAYELGEIHRQVGRPGEGARALRARRRALSRLRGRPVGLGRVLIAQGKPDAGSAAPPQGRLARTPRTTSPTSSSGRRTGRSGNAAEQEKAQAEFQRLRSRKREQEAAGPAPPARR